MAFRCAVSKDHPHAYGDKCKKCLRFTVCAGSSPRVWGQDDQLAEYYDFLKDHPHAYGDKQKFHLRRLSFMGSSPRVWGQAFLLKRLKEKQGIIPTRMGTRHSNICSLSCCTDHPHAYGDKRCKFCDNYFVGRIIPTRMGTSLHRF